MSRSAIPRPMPLDAPVTIATFALAGELRPEDVARPSIVCTATILLSLALRNCTRRKTLACAFEFDGRSTIKESLANGLRRYSLKGTTFTESDHNCGDIRAGLLRRFGERCSRNVRDLKTRSLVRC